MPLEPHFQYYIDRLEPPEGVMSSIVRRTLLSKYIVTPEGRARICRSMLPQTRLRIDSQIARGDGDFYSIICHIEDVLAILPHNERFTEPAVELRDQLMTALNFQGITASVGGALEQHSRSSLNLQVSVDPLDIILEECTQ